MDDSALVRAMLAGEEAAFDEFFDRHFTRIYRFALARVGSETTAEDVSQQTLVTAMRKLHTWRGDASLMTWLCAICRRELMAHGERLGRDALVTALDDDPQVRRQLEGLSAGPGVQPDCAFEQQEAARLVQLTLDYLPDRYGDVLEWKYLLGYSVLEIADRLKTTPKAVESLLTRAREAFRRGFTAVSDAASKRPVTE